MLGCRAVSGGRGKALITHVFKLAKYVGFLQQFLRRRLLPAKSRLLHIYNLAHQLLLRCRIYREVDRPLAPSA